MTSPFFAFELEDIEPLIWRRVVVRTLMNLKAALIGMRGSKLQRRPSCSSVPFQSSVALPTAQIDHLLFNDDGRV
jgi:hypothetical protein